MSPPKRKRQQSASKTQSKIPRVQTKLEQLADQAQALSEEVEKHNEVVEEERNEEVDGGERNEKSEDVDVEIEKSTQEVDTQEEDEEGEEDGDEEDEEFGDEEGEEFGDEEDEEGEEVGDEEDEEVGDEDEENVTPSVERSTIDLEYRTKFLHDSNVMSISSDPTSPSTSNSVRTFCIDKFRVKMPIDNNTNLTGDSIVRSTMGKNFDKFRVILKEQKLEAFFRASYFGHFLDLPEDNNARFQMTMVYELLKRRIKFDNELKKMDEIWINYCGLPVCFGLKEFAIITGLRCHYPDRSQYLPIITAKKKIRTPKTAKKTKKGKEKADDNEDLVSIVGQSYKTKDLIQDLESKKLSLKHKKSLCLVWFVHCILWAKDINQVISASVIKFSQDLEAFNNYPWGRESFFLTVKYLMTELSPKTINLYGFPWAFMAWAFEAIPHLRQQVKDYSEEVSYPRILIWLSANNNKKVNALQLFNPPEEAIVYPWLVPTKRELVMPCLVTLGPVHTLPDSIDRIKKELARVTAIKRQALGVGEHVLGVGAAGAAGATGAAVGGAVDLVGVVDDVGVGGDGGGGDGVGADVGVGGDGGGGDVGVGGDGGGSDGGGAHVEYSEVRVDHSDGGGGFGGFGGYTPFSGHANVDAGTSKMPCSACQCESCKRRHEELVKSIETLTEAINNLASKRGVNPSKRISEPYTPLQMKVRNRKRVISQAVSAAKAKRAATPNPLTADVGPFERKKVNIYKSITATKRKDIEKIIKSKRGQPPLIRSSMHEFGPVDFKIMTSMNEWWLDSYVDEVMLLMRMRHIRFPEHYDSSDRILELSFFNNFSRRYKELTDEAITPGGRPLKQLLHEFIWDDDVINYCRGKRPYPGGYPWIGAKRILTVMNLDVKHFMTLEILINEGVVNVYDCNPTVFEDYIFSCHIESVLELFPKLLKQSGMFKHLPENLLNERWSFDGRIEHLPRNETFAACASWSLAFIEHLLTDTSIKTPETLLNDNTVERMQWVWAAGVVDKELVP